jgi:hypothetical protein
MLLNFIDEKHGSDMTKAKTKKYSLSQNHLKGLSGYCLLKIRPFAPRRMTASLNFFTCNFSRDIIYGMKNLMLGLYIVHLDTIMFHCIPQNHSIGHWALSGA